MSAAGDSSQADHYQKVDGFQWPRIFDPDNYRALRNYKPNDGELFIVTFPKCGTSWMAQIVYLIYNKGAEPNRQSLRSIPFPDLFGVDSVDSELVPKPVKMRTHLPFSVMPWSNTAKYICVARNPKDCCVSYYHFTSSHMEFDDFFELFVSGKTGYGNYFDHVKDWYEQRQRSNVLFLTYESMQNDVRSSILEIARFLGEEHLTAVSDENVMNNVIKYSSFQYMKQNASSDDGLGPAFGKNLSTLGPNIDQWPVSKALKFTFKIFAKNKGQKKRASGPMMRKGVVGDWKNMFSED